MTDEALIRAIRRAPRVRYVQDDNDQFHLSYASGKRIGTFDRDQLQRVSYRIRLLVISEAS